MRIKPFITAAALLCAVAVVNAAPTKKAPARVPAGKVQTVRRAPAPAAKPPAPAKRAPVAVKAPPPHPVPVVKASPQPGYRPAGTVAFADLGTVASTVASIGGKSDPILALAVPSAIRGQAVVKLFGAMRKGEHGVAVCYVDPVIAARVAAAKKPSDADLDRVKRWSVVYPCVIGRDQFVAKHPQGKFEADGTFRLPPGPHSSRTFWVWFSPDSRWAVLAPSPSMARNAHVAAAGELVRPLGPDLARVRMDANGARAIFGSAICAGGTMHVRMTAAGLELSGSGRTSVVRPPLPPGSLEFSGVPASAPLFGVTTTPDDVRNCEDIFAMAGPAFGMFVRSSLQYVNRAGSSGYYLSEAGPVVGTPKQRLLKILPEAASMPATANAMFCSPTTVLRLCIPKVAAKLMPFESAKLQVGLRLLRRVRGDGLGLMSWREGGEDRFLMRISRDELYGTSALWSALFF